jgi:hypothetical protein
MEALERTDRLIEIARMMRAMKTPHTALIWTLKAIMNRRRVLKTHTYGELSPLEAIILGAKWRMGR